MLFKAEDRRATYPHETSYFEATTRPLQNTFHRKKRDMLFQGYKDICLIIVTFCGIDLCFINYKKKIRNKFVIEYS